MGPAKAILFAALLAATFGFAQDNPSNRTSGQSSGALTNQNSGSDQPLGVQGCLSSSAMGDTSFTITQDQTGKVYRLTGNVSQLVSHAGQEVVISGTVGDRVSTSSNTTAENSNGAEPSALQVSEVTMISEHCGGAGSTPPARKDHESEPQTAEGTDKTLQPETPAPQDSSTPPLAQSRPAGSDIHKPEHSPKAQEGDNLPQTATILPLLGLVGLSSLVTGFIFRVR